MSVLGDIARENDVHNFCKRIEAKIRDYPEAATALKELGLEIFEILPNVPEWAHKYRELFSK